MATLRERALIADTVTAARARAGLIDVNATSAVTHNPADSNRKPLMRQPRTEINACPRAKYRAAMQKSTEFTRVFDNSRRAPHKSPIMPTIALIGGAHIHTPGFINAIKK